MVRPPPRSTRPDTLFPYTTLFRSSDLCIKLPVFATVLSLIVLLIGLISYSRLPVREYPNIDEPVVTVQTTYLGASAEIMESQVTKPLEDSLSGIEGIEFMTTVSRAEARSEERRGGKGCGGTG